ncbi:hypothetical protein SAMN04489760_1412 [Syntrophus gentianae]|uniref:Uncharacterized protein n=1 Tax=Syntrophus gentianae TaxID=43775 RepID=A0A1H8AXE6_9BACT|nr:cytoplasmic protein [Syntrophus gentianae]SEM74167.1 hypothetical protein SAMN04489760_1412 [Syntrophus gentianae]
MKLGLTEEEKDYVKISYISNHFEVNFGKNRTKSREYNTVEEMMEEFQENKIERADFDDKAHLMFNLAFGK